MLSSSVTQAPNAVSLESTRLSVYLWLGCKQKKKGGMKTYYGRVEVQTADRIDEEKYRVECIDKFSGQLVASSGAVVTYWAVS